MAYADPFGSFIDGFRQGEADARKAAGDSKRSRRGGGGGAESGSSGGRGNDDLIPNAPIQPGLRPGDRGFVPLPRPPVPVLGDQNPSRGYGETEGPGADALPSTPFDRAPPNQMAPEDGMASGGATGGALAPAPAPPRPRGQIQSPEDGMASGGVPGAAATPLPPNPFTAPEDFGSPGVASPSLEDVLNRLPPPPPIRPPDNVDVLRMIDREARAAGRVPFWVPTQRVRVQDSDPFGRPVGPPRDVIQRNPDYIPPPLNDGSAQSIRMRREATLPEIRRRSAAGQLTREQFNYLMRYMQGDPDLTNPFEGVP